MIIIRNKIAAITTILMLSVSVGNIQTAYAQQATEGLVFCVSHAHKIIFSNPEDIDIGLAAVLWENTEYNFTQSRAIAELYNIKNAINELGYTVGGYEQIQSRSIRDALQYTQFGGYIIYDKNIATQENDKIYGDWVIDSRNAGRTASCSVIQEVAVCIGKDGLYRPCS